MMRLSTLAGLSMLAVSSLGCAISISDKLAAAHYTPLTIKPGHLSIDVCINGGPPRRIGFDTGASGKLWVTPGLVTEYKFERIGQASASDRGPASRTIDIVNVPTISVGTRTYRDVPAFVFAPDQVADPAVAGSLGFELFADELLILDFPRARLGVAAGELPPPEGVSTLA